jgi:deoxyribose-phosphate aldolase
MCIQGGGSLKDIARYIDHTLLRPEATKDQIRKLCEEAKEYGFAAVCVNPTYVALAAKLLQDSLTKVCTVVGFPLGAHISEIKAVEAERAIRDGAKEIDMVINIGALKSGDDDLVYRDIAAVVDVCHDGGAACKVIIEAALLNDDEKVRACQASRRARADFVKTSTGFGPSGATVHDVALMVQAVQGTSMGVKAAGGIRTLAEAREMLEAGATRIGTSAGVLIMKEWSRLSES